MADNSLSSSSSIDSLVKQIIDHPDFKNAIRGSEGSSTSTSSPPQTTTCVTPTQATTCTTTQQGSQDQHYQTPMQEFRRIFHRSVTNPPQFAARTTWALTGRSVRSSSSKKNFKRDHEGKAIKTTTFSREVVLLRGPQDTMARGRAKAELQRMGHVINCFVFMKNWSARIVHDKLASAFQSKLDGITSEPK